MAKQQPAKMPPVLGPQVLARLEEYERRLHDLIPLCEQYEGCGIDCRDYRETIQAAQAEIAQIKATFFPQGKRRR